MDGGEGGGFSLDYGEEGACNDLSALVELPDTANEVNACVQILDDPLDTHHACVIEREQLLTAAKQRRVAAAKSITVSSFGVRKQALTALEGVLNAQVDGVDVILGSDAGHHPQLYWDTSVSGAPKIPGWVVTDLETRMACRGQLGMVTNPDDDMRYDETNQIVWLKDYLTDRYYIATIFCREDVVGYDDVGYTIEQMWQSSIHVDPGAKRGRAIKDRRVRVRAVRCDFYPRGLSRSDTPSHIYIKYSKLSDVCLNRTEWHDRERMWGFVAAPSAGMMPNRVGKISQAGRINQ
jgi:hypothetical protein